MLEKKTMIQKKDNEIVIVDVTYEYCYKCGMKLDNGFCKQCKKVRKVNSSIHYLAQITLKSVNEDTIKIKTIKKHLPIAEYVVMKKRFEGWVETKAKTLEIVKNEGYPPLEVITIHIEKIPALKGLREELTKDG